MQGLQLPAEKVPGKHRACEHGAVGPRVLPDFTEHLEDRKNHEFDAPVLPSEHVRWFLDKQIAAFGKPRDQLRILDVGCGRGDTVAWLRAQGWDSYGVDVGVEYIERGRHYLKSVGDDPGRLTPAGDDLTYPFPDGFFDLVLSDQVIEHVGDLDGFASEVARVSAPGSLGLHIYPAKWCPIEPHLLTPFTHWLPKGPLRRTAEAASLRLGWGAPYFTEYSLRERVEIYNRFSEEKTFYRPLSTTVATLSRHGLDCEIKQSSQDRIAIRAAGVDGRALALLGWLCRHLHSVALYTRRRSRDL